VATKSLKIEHVVASINVQTGGPAYTVSRICDELTDRGLTVRLNTLNYPGLGVQATVEKASLNSVPTNLLDRWFRGSSKQLKQSLAQHAVDSDLIHSHGLWMQPNRYARLAALSQAKPLVISTRGMLDDWARRRAILKKKLAWMAFEKKNLAAASLFHATAKSELEAIREVGLSAPVAVIPNGVDHPLRLDPNVARELMVRRWPELTNKRCFLFLSRLHQKKGLDILLKSWAQQAALHTKWHLLIAGPDLTGYKKSLLKMINELGLADRVSLTGPLAGEYKAAAFELSDLFVLPTRAENFGVVVAEALAYGLPVSCALAGPFGAWFWLVD